MCTRNIEETSLVILVKSKKAVQIPKIVVDVKLLIQSSLTKLHETVQILVILSVLVEHAKQIRLFTSLSHKTDCMNPFFTMTPRPPFATCIHLDHEQSQKAAAAARESDRAQGKIMRNHQKSSITDNEKGEENKSQCARAPFDEVKRTKHVRTIVQSIFVMKWMRETCE